MDASKDWMKVYETAVLETNALLMKERIDDARRAIADRVANNGLDLKERQAIIDALNALSVLKRERVTQPH